LREIFRDKPVREATLPNFDLRALRILRGKNDLFFFGYRFAALSKQ
jgi:hypothetical protein